ncbi:hypothetical protein AVEN_30685-1 [Araneus ventricosus]|uniref:Mos1 transposase HTH domain-containing protein n=1 Tax=Araneus ventricosus TaxID=182803 RepID=A0A4Y2MF53_ARAVE|nr:hypothetical protein AVEN_40034-1 [Araneus ventricosus]GBN25762.1 hypothetical protein AVEN_30685-1 [Araneus ventricosus]
MAYLIAEYAKFEVRAVIRVLQAEGVNQSEIHHRLQGVYGPKGLRNCIQPLKRKGQEDYAKELNFCTMTQDPIRQIKSKRGWHNRNGRSWHSTLSLDLGPSNFHLFGPLKKFFAGKIFADQKDLQNTFLEYFKQLDKQQYYKVMPKLVPCWD